MLFSIKVYWNISKIILLLRFKEAGGIGKLVIFHVPSHRYPGQPFGNKRLLKVRYWKELIRKSGLSIIELIGDNPNPIFISFFRMYFIFEHLLKKYITCHRNCYADQIFFF